MILDFERIYSVKILKKQAFSDENLTKGDDVRFNWVCHIGGGPLFMTFVNKMTKEIAFREWCLGAFLGAEIQKKR